MVKREPRNPFYLLLLLDSLVFVITALGDALLLILEQKALERGEIPPPLPFRELLRHDGWRWLLYELAAMTHFGLASMGRDQWRQSKSRPPEPRP